MRRLTYFPFMILFALLLNGCGGEKEKTVIYLVRHAEKDLTDTTDNPPLTQEGEDRAIRLVEEMRGIELEGIYSTRYDRNMNTVRPLSEERNMVIQNYGWYEWQPVLDGIKKTSGKNFLICGHGDNLLPMIEYLGGEKPIDKLGKHEYDKLFKVVLFKKDVETSVASY